MNFSTHKNQIADLIEIALRQNKPDLIAKFRIILNQANTLFKTEDFNFWLQQIGSIPCEEIPLTKFGLQEASYSVANLRNLDRHNFKSRILNICEQLFTYSNEDELCPWQSVYHYYFYLPEQKVFRESKLGTCDLLQSISPSQVRIAKISELGIDPTEYI